MLLLEGFSKLPNFTRLLHVDNMDVHLLTTTRSNPGSLSLVVIFSHFETTHRVPRLVDNNLPGRLCSLFVPTHHVDSPTWKHTHMQEAPQAAQERADLSLPFWARAMAVALPMPLLAPVIMKDLPTTDTSRSCSSKPFAAASYPFLKTQTKTSKSLTSKCDG